MTEDKIIGYPFRFGGTWYIRKARNAEEVVELIIAAGVGITPGKLSIVHGGYVDTGREGVLSFQVSHAEHPLEYDTDLDHTISFDPRKIVEAEVSKKTPNWHLVEAASREFVMTIPTEFGFLLMLPISKGSVSSLSASRKPRSLNSSRHCQVV